MLPILIDLALFFFLLIFVFCNCNLLTKGCKLQLYFLTVSTKQVMFDHDSNPGHPSPFHRQDVGITEQ